jgi:hypothetical protein
VLRSVCFRPTHRISGSRIILIRTTLAPFAESRYNGPAGDPSPTTVVGRVPDIPGTFLASDCVLFTVPSDLPDADLSRHNVARRHFSSGR